MPPKKPPPMQRAASLVHLFPLLAELGVDPEEALKDSGVSVADVRPDAFIPYAGYLRILARCTKLLGFASARDRRWRRSALSGAS